MSFLSRNFSLIIVLPFLFVTLGCSLGGSSKSRDMQTVEIYKTEEQLRRIRRDGGEERALRKLEKELQRKRRVRKALLVREELAAQAKQESVERDIKRIRRKHSGETQYFRTELQKGVDHLYKEALKLYKDGSYESAKEMLLEVEELWPDYKFAEKYLALIDSGNNIESVSVNSGSNKDNILESQDFFISDSLNSFERE